MRAALLIAVGVFTALTSWSLLWTVPAGCCLAVCAYLCCVDWYDEKVREAETLGREIERHQADATL